MTSRRHGLANICSANIKRVEFISEGALIIFMHLFFRWNIFSIVKSTQSVHKRSKYRQQKKYNTKRKERCQDFNHYMPKLLLKPLKVDLEKALFKGWLSV